MIIHKPRNFDRLVALYQYLGGDIYPNDMAVYVCYNEDTGRITTKGYEALTWSNKVKEIKDPVKFLKEVEG